MSIHRLDWSKAKGCWTQDGEPITKDGKYADGNNLYLVLNGKWASFMFRYKFDGHPKSFGLGSVDIFKLPEVRETARKYCQMLEEGKDPKAEGKHPKAMRNGAKLDQEIRAGRAKTVSQVVDEYCDDFIALNEPSTILRVQNQFKNHVRAKIGDMPIEKVDSNILLTVGGLKNLWKEQNPTAREIRSHLRRIFSFAITHGYYHGTNPAAWEGQLENSLPPSHRVHTPTHRASLPVLDIGRYMAELRAFDSKSRNPLLQGHPAIALMLEWIILSAGRMSEPRLAEHKEFDLQNMIWNLPWERRKNRLFVPKGEVHPVPITQRMAAVIEEMLRRPIDHSANALMFPSPYGGRYNKGSCLQFVRDTLTWESKIDTHGFRRTFTTWAAVRYDKILIDHQLDHKGQDKTDQAYFPHPSDTINERRLMMTAWGEFCDRLQPVPGTNVAEFNEAKKRRRAS
jgi:integrase